MPAGKTLQVRILASFLSLLGLVGCVGPAATLTVADASSVRASFASAQMENIHVFSLTDRREKDAVLTDIYGRPMDGVELVDWLQSEMELRGIQFIEAEMVNQIKPTGNCLIDLELRRAILGSQETTKISTLVFGVRHHDESRPYKIIRGNTTSVNWIGNSREANGALRDALNAAINNLITYCEST